MVTMELDLDFSLDVDFLLAVQITPSSSQTNNPNTTYGLQIADFFRFFGNRGYLPSAKA